MLGAVNSNPTMAMSVGTQTPNETNSLFVASGMNERNGVLFGLLSTLIFRIEITIRYPHFPAHQGLFPFLEPGQIWPF